MNFSIDNITTTTLATTTTTMETTTTMSTTMSANISNATTPDLLALQMADLSQLKNNLDEFFVIVMAIIVFMMQGGFALVEAGGVRSKSTTSILIKNFLDAFLAGVAYWVFGFALAFGEGNSFIGWNYWATSWLPPSKLSLFFYQYVFASTASTIISAAMAERCEFIPFLIYNVFIIGFVYPVVTHWAWFDGGWLKQGRWYEIDGKMVNIGFRDFSGSGVVHMCGGVAGFVGAVLLGPRIGRFRYGRHNPFRGHSVPLAAIGGFILTVGFLAFNSSSGMSISRPGDGDRMALAVVNTIICGSFSSVTSLFISRHAPWCHGKWSFVRTLNGAVCGMVASCAGCNVVYPWGAAVTGVFASCVYEFWFFMVEKMHIDDPLDIVAQHFGGGSLGLIAVAFLDRNQGILFRWDWHSGLFLGWQLAGLFCILAWTAAWAFVMFGLLRVCHILRVPEEVEMKGLDIPKHGEPAYPVEAYGHGWIEKIIGQMQDGVLPMDKELQTIKDEGPYETPEVKNMETKNGQPPALHTSRLVADEVVVDSGKEKKAFHTAYIVTDDIVNDPGKGKKIYHVAYPIANEVVVMAENGKVKHAYRAPYPVTDEAPVVMPQARRPSLVSRMDSYLSNVSGREEVQVTRI